MSAMQGGKATHVMRKWNVHLLLTVIIMGYVFLEFVHAGILILDQVVRQGAIERQNLHVRTAIKLNYWEELWRKWGLR